MEASRWPIDYDSLNKGDVIPRERLETITGHKAGSKGYQLKCLAILKTIERELFLRNKPWTVTIHKDEIHVLTDAEASTHNHSLQKQYRRGQLKRFGLNSSVDISALDIDQRHQHERAMEVDGKYVQAILNVREQLRLRGHKRNTPVLGQH